MLAGVAGASHAATFVEYDAYQLALNPGEVLVTNFDGPSITVPAGFTAGGTAHTMTGFSNIGAAPAISATTNDPTSYLSVAAGQTFTLDTPALSEFSLYVGSLDPFNRITFTGAGGFSQSFTGLDLMAATAAADQANGNRTSGASNGRYSFTFDQAITGVQLTSTSPSFEVSNIGGVFPELSALPEPGAWALMMLGFGGLGQTLRSRRRLAALA